MMMMNMEKKLFLEATFKIIIEEDGKRCIDFSYKRDKTAYQHELLRTNIAELPKTIEKQENFNTETK